MFFGTPRSMRYIVKEEPKGIQLILVLEFPMAMMALTTALYVADSWLVELENVGPKKHQIQETPNALPLELGHLPRARSHLRGKEKAQRLSCWRDYEVW